MDGWIGAAAAALGPALALLAAFFIGWFVAQAFGPQKRFEYLLLLVFAVFVLMWLGDIGVQRTLLGPTFVSQAYGEVVQTLDCYQKGTVVSYRAQPVAGYQRMPNGSILWVSDPGIINETPRPIGASPAGPLG